MVDMTNVIEQRISNNEKSICENAPTGEFAEQ
jgi:hypothetical protein